MRDIRAWFIELLGKDWVEAQERRFSELKGPLVIEYEISPKAFEVPGKWIPPTPARGK